MAIDRGVKLKVRGNELTRDHAVRDVPQLRPKPFRDRTFSGHENYVHSLPPLAGDGRKYFFKDDPASEQMRTFFGTSEDDPEERG
jgi:hypothetical protein